METDATTAATFVNVANWQGVDDKPTVGSDNLVKSGGVYGDITQINNIIGSDDGIVYEGSSVKGTILFTKNDVNIGDTLYIEKIGSGSFVTFYDESGQELWHGVSYPINKEIPVGFSYAKNDYGPDGTITTYRISKHSMLKYRITKLDQATDYNKKEIAKVEEAAKSLKLSIGYNDGVVIDGTYTKGDTLFTKSDVNVGDELYIEQSNNQSPFAPFVTFYDNNGQELFHITNKSATIEVPDSFDYALADYGPTGLQNTFRVINKSQIKYRITKLDNRVNNIEPIVYRNRSDIGSNDGLLCDGTFNKLAVLFTSNDVNVGDKIIIQQHDGPNAVTFYNAENQELYHSVPASTELQESTIPNDFYKAIVDYGPNGSSTFTITNLSQIKYRVSTLENKFDNLSKVLINERDYGIISAKIELPSDSHDKSDYVDIMSVSSNADSHVALKFILKKEVTSVRDTAVGVCPVPKYNAGLIAGFSNDMVYWIAGKSISWNSGIIVNDEEGKCSGKQLIMFDSIVVNTSSSDVRISWYFDETQTNVQFVQHTRPLVNERIDVPTGAKYFAISTKITDVNASVIFNGVGISDYKLLSPDGWNYNLLLGPDAMALRFSGDVTDTNNQDIRLKIDDNAVTIYHGTDNSVIHVFDKVNYPDAKSLYLALNELTDYSVELLDVSGISFDDFIKCDVSLVAQYNVKKQSEPSVSVVEWDSFPFYFTTKEKNGIYNFEFGFDYSDSNGKKLQAIINGYPILSTDNLYNFINNYLTITYGNEVIVHKHNFNTRGEFYCPIRRMFYVEGMREGIENGTGSAAHTCSATIEEAFDIMLNNGGKNIGYEDLMKEVLGDYKTSDAQFTFTSDDNDFTLYENSAIRNMFARKGVTPATFFMLDMISSITSRLSIIKACLSSGYYCGVHSPYEYTQTISIGMLRYEELVDAIEKTFDKFVELFGRQPLVWDFHMSGESYNTVRYLINHGYKFVMGGGYAGDYGIVSTITRYRIQRFGIRPNAQGQNVRMPDDWLFKKY